MFLVFSFFVAPVIDRRYLARFESLRGKLTGHWIFDGEFDFEAHGFVYLITSIASGRRYIGRKTLTYNVKLKPLKGRVNKRHRTVESDWRKYEGSSKSLAVDILAEGKEQFSFEVLSFHESKSMLAYYEAKEIIDRNALFDDAFYNIGLKIRFRC